MKESTFKVWFDDAVRAARSLLATPRYSLPALASLVLGVGAATAVLAMFTAVFFRPLPFPREDELVRIRVVFLASDMPEGTSPSYPYYEELNQLKPVFRSVSAWMESNVTLAEGGEARRARGASVTPEFFDTLETPAILGRTFTATGAAADGKDVVVLSRSYWRSSFRGEDVIGRKVLLDGRPTTIIGVVDDERALPSGRDLWIPLRLSEEYRTNRFMGIFRLVGRLQPGVSFEAGRERLRAVTLAQGFHGDDGTPVFANYQSLREFLLGDKRTPGMLMLTAVVAFLLLACANVAALMLTRASVRSRELAVRAAVGAGSGDLARQAFLESLVLGLAGSLVGLLLAVTLVRAENHYYAAELEYATARLDLRALLAFAVVALLSSVAIGWAPTLYARRIRPMDSLRADGRSSASHGARRVREVLVAAQVAITLALVVSASALVRSVKHLHEVVPGFDSSVVVARVAASPTRRADPVMLMKFVHAVREAAAHAPGVTAAAVATDVPFDDTSLSLTTDNGPGAMKNNQSSFVHYVGSEYFDVMGIPLLEGRRFTRADESEKVHVVAVSRAFATQYLGTENAIGRSISFGEREGEKNDGAQIWYEIVAIVGDVLDQNVTAPAAPTIYLPYRSENPFGHGFAVLARGPIGAEVLADTLQRAVHEVDRDATLYETDTVGALLERSYRGRTALEQLLTLFAVSSLLLAGIGLFGVTSYTVAERSGEIGIRRALGASHTDILVMILRETSVVVGLGVLGGVACALATRTLLASFLYGVVASDAATYLSVGVGIVAMAMLAALAPARAAAAVMPSRALEVR